VGALLGLYLARLLPEHHLSADSRDVVKLVTGVVATLSALVLGLLIASAKNSFDTINSALKQSAAKVIVIDRLLAQYGPEAKGIREALRNTYAARVDELFTASARDGGIRLVLREASSGEEIGNRVRALVPATELQRGLQLRAVHLIGEVEQARWLGFEEAESRTPTAFLVVLVSWLAAMFAGFGLFAPRNATALAALAIGALAVSTAVFLIEEMGRPLDGVIAIPSEPMRSALDVLGR
jgi:hypothetical protein